MILSDYRLWFVQSSKHNYYITCINVCSRANSLSLIGEKPLIILPTSVSYPLYTVKQTNTTVVLQMLMYQVVCSVDRVARPVLKYQPRNKFQYSKYIMSTNCLTIQPLIKENKYNSL